MSLCFIINSCQNIKKKTKKLNPGLKTNQCKAWQQDQHEKDKLFKV